MATTVQRYQNPNVNDTVVLSLFTYNNANFSNVESIEKIDIYFLDPNEKTSENPDGRRWVQTIPAAQVQTTDTGSYQTSLVLEEPKYVIGTYYDIWTINFSSEQPAAEVVNVFQVFPQRWYTTPIPVVYDFTFHFQPNKLRYGSKQYIRIETIPNVPQASDVARYYENLAIAADLRIYIEQFCGDCVPEESDLRLVLEDEPVTQREKRWSYYKIDTEDYDPGLYNIWFKMEFGGNVYISDKQQLLIYN